MDDVLREIYDNLKAMRNYSGFSNPGYKLACDFFIPTKNVIIEYDERQHFTEQRAKSLAYYPSNLNLRFDKDKWREACENIKATDNDPLYRDEQRAFYDSVRDISAARNGVPLIRIKHGDYDWESKSGTKVIDELINLRKLNTHALDLEGTIEELAWDFSCVQKAYHDWAKQFDNHNEVINWLKEHGIDVSRCRKQDPFKLHSSDWNSITVPTLYKLVPDCMVWMEDIFDKWFQNLSEAQIARDTIWYLLFFIHPVRHELYYFDIHYPDGYSSRLARSIRSHRLGLKGAKKYLRCLFSWEKIPGNDNGRLIEYLMQNFNIEWVKAAKIKKNDDGKTIRITSETNSLSLTLNDEKTNVNLEIDDGRTDKFIVKTEFGGLNIFSRDGRTTDDSYIRACGTTAFKHIHLHPTTSNWKKPNLQDLKEASIRHLGIGEGDLSPDEQKIAIALSARATPSFGLWINYAQCAINEGPIFTLKKNKRHSDCFNELVGILQGTDQNQKDIRNKLEEYYNIEVIIDTK